MTTPTQGGPRRRRAAIIGLSLDGPLRPHRLISGEDRLVIGGSEQSRQDLLETMLRLDAELERLGVHLADVEPAELAEIAWRIDSPELACIALRIEEGLQRRGQTFQESTPEELTKLACGDADV